MTDVRGVCAGSAEELAPGVPYVRGWADAKRAADALAEPLRVLDLQAIFAQLKPDVNVHGEGVVRLGTVRPAAAHALATLIMTGLTVEVLAESADGAPTGPPLDS
ncbi:hypothetical protein [Streptomyces sp. MP131-18]|uniref:hypothetical protein n=1 Tax=Streptomyces sp. MP131-18 TaxID=1857892 RepID=UPI0009D5A5A2|nr:hypothetical protein [Streptomyces sp. MP131-18]ONK11206.1 hypothetical protein STBA_19360 [Streptomyces sp. MP131-18]